MTLQIMGQADSIAECAQTISKLDVAVSLGLIAHNKVRSHMYYVQFYIFSRDINFTVLWLSCEILLPYYANFNEEDYCTYCRIIQGLKLHKSTLAVFCEIHEVYVPWNLYWW